VKIEKERKKKREREREKERKRERERQNRGGRENRDERIDIGATSSVAHLPNGREGCDTLFSYGTHNRREKSGGSRVDYS